MRPFPAAAEADSPFSTTFAGGPGNAANAAAGAADKNAASNAGAQRRRRECI